MKRDGVTVLAIAWIVCGMADIVCILKAPDLIGFTILSTMLTCLYGIYKLIKI